MSYSEARSAGPPPTVFPLSELRFSEQLEMSARQEVEVGSWRSDGGNAEVLVDGDGGDR